MQGKRGVRLGRPFGLPLYLHGSWFPALALLAAHFSITTFGGVHLVEAIGLSVLCALGVLGVVVVHELAHLGLARAAGLRVADSVLYPLGGVMRYRAEPRRPHADTSIALAGPIASAALGALGVFVARSWHGATAEAVRTVALASIVLAAINVIPGLPLDGGRVLRDVMWSKSGSRFRATRVATAAGQLAGVALAASGVWIVLRKPSAGGTDGLWILIVGAMTLTIATRMRGASAVAAVLEGQSAGEWARPFVGRLRFSEPVPAGDGPYAVSDDGRLAGVLTGGAVGRIAGEAMVPWRQDLSCAATDPLSVALERMAVTGAGVVVVLDAGGVVRGVLSEDGVRARLRTGA